MRLLEREVSRLRETVDRLTKARAERAAEGPNSESEGQKGGISSARGTKGKASGDPTGTIMGLPPTSLPHLWSASRRSCCPDEVGGNTNNREADKRDPVARDLETR